MISGLHNWSTYSTGSERKVEPTNPTFRDKQEEEFIVIDVEWEDIEKDDAVIPYKKLDNDYPLRLYNRFGKIIIERVKPKLLTTA